MGEDAHREPWRPGELELGDLAVTDQHGVEAVVQQPPHRVRRREEVVSGDRDRREHGQVHVML